MRSPVLAAKRLLREVQFAEAHGRDPIRSASLRAYPDDYWASWYL